MDTEEIVGLILMAFFVVGGVIAFFDVGVLDPLRAEDAREDCLERGYLSYVSYRGMIFSSEAFGVICEYPATNSNINLNNANPLIQVNTKD